MKHRDFDSEVESIVDAARCMLDAMVRSSTITVEEALAVLEIARREVEAVHGSQSIGAILVRSIYHELSSKIRRVQRVSGSDPALEATVFPQPGNERTASLAPPLPRSRRRRRADAPSAYTPR